MDQTYFHSSHEIGKIWLDDSRRAIYSPIFKGDRIFIIHAGGDKGFIPGALCGKCRRLQETIIKI